MIDRDEIIFFGKPLEIIEIPYKVMKEYFENKKEVDNANIKTNSK